MVMLKSLFLAGLMLNCVFADSEKPSMAALQVQSNFDFSLTRNEFRVQYFGLGEGFQTSKAVDIKIFQKTGSIPKLVHTFTLEEEKAKKEKKAYHFALENVDDGEYEVDVCAGEMCSGKTPSLTDIENAKGYKISCLRGRMDNGNWVSATPPTFEVEFEGPTKEDWIKPGDFSQIDSDLSAALSAVKRKTIVYKTDYTKYNLAKNPTYEKNQNLFYAAVRFDIAKYSKLFDQKTGDSDIRPEYSHDICDRKYLLSAHAHIVDKTTKEVKYRFKTTLFLSASGKQYFIKGNKPVHVEMTHENANIAKGVYKVWITFCATEKDAIESTFCAEPIIHDSDLNVEGSDE